MADQDPATNPFRAPIAVSDRGGDSGLHHAQRGAYERDRFFLGRRAFAIDDRFDIADDDGERLLEVHRRSTLLASLALGAAASLTFLAIAGGALALGFNVVEQQIALPTLLGGFLGGAAVAYALVVRLARRPDLTIRGDRIEEPLVVVRHTGMRLLAAGWDVLADGIPIARLRTDHLANLVRRRWRVVAPDGRLLGGAKEDHLLLALVRRLVGSAFGLLRTGYRIVGPDGADLGTLERRYGLVDRYVLDLRGDSERIFDRRVAVALALMLDGGDRR